MKRPRRPHFRIPPIFLAALGSASVLAQSTPLPPDAGRILQETRPAERPPVVTVPPIQPPAPLRPAVPAVSGDVRVHVSHFEFTGNRALTTETLRAAVAPWAGRALTFGDLIQVVEAVEARYKAAGYFLAQAYLPPQNIKEGAIEIAISEGRMGAARLEGESRVAPDVLFGYLDRLPKDEALTLALLERQVLLINELAGGRASLDLQAGDKPGSTDVVLALQAEDPVGGRLDVNNHGSTATGDYRVGLNLNANSPFNLGERLTASALTTDTVNLVSYNLRGELPVGSDGWRLSAAVSRAEYSLGGAFASLKASGQADSLRLGAAYPLIRSRASNLKVQLEADQNNLVDNFRAAKLQLDKQSSGFTFSVNGDWLDEFLGGGSSRVDLSLRAGQLDLGPSAKALDARPAGLDTAGSFGKSVLTLQRQQTLGRDLSLQLSITDQRAGRNLDSSEKLSLGGPTTLPGYASGEASGDSGTHARLALRWQALSELAITLFANEGRLRLVRNPLPTAATNDKQVADCGFSADWQIGRSFTASAIVAWASTATAGAPENGNPRGWISLGYGW